MAGRRRGATRQRASECRGARGTNPIRAEKASRPSALPTQRGCSRLERGLRQASRAADTPVRDVSRAPAVCSLPRPERGCWRHGAERATGGGAPVDCGSVGFGGSTGGPLRERATPRRDAGRVQVAAQPLRAAGTGVDAAAVPTRMRPERTGTVGGRGASVSPLAGGHRPAGKVSVCAANARVCGCDTAVSRLRDERACAAAPRAVCTAALPTVCRPLRLASRRRGATRGGVGLSSARHVWGVCARPAALDADCEHTRCALVRLSAAATARQQVPDASAAERGGRAVRTEDGAASRLLQRAQSGHAHPPQLVYEPETPAALHQEETQDRTAHRGDRARRSRAHPGGRIRLAGHERARFIGGHAGCACGQTHRATLRPLQQEVLAAGRVAPAGGVSQDGQPHRRPFPGGDHPRSAGRSGGEQVLACRTAPAVVRGLLPGRPAAVVSGDAGQHLPAPVRGDARSAIASRVAHGAAAGLAGAAVSVLLVSDRAGHVAAEQQPALRRLHQVAGAAVCRPRPERQPEHRRPDDVPLFAGAAHGGVLGGGASVEAEHLRPVRIGAQLGVAERLRAVRQGALAGRQVVLVQSGGQRYPQVQRAVHPGAVPLRDPAERAVSGVRMSVARAGRDVAGADGRTPLWALAGVADRAVGVGHESIRQIVLGGKVAQDLGRVGRHADHLGVKRLERGRRVAERARLPGAAGGERLGKEEYYDGSLVAESSGVEGLAAVIRSRERLRHLAYLHSGHRVSQEQERTDEEERGKKQRANGATNERGARQDRAATGTRLWDTREVMRCRPRIPNAEVFQRGCERPFGNVTRTLRTTDRGMRPDAGNRQAARTPSHTHRTQHFDARVPPESYLNWVSLLPKPTHREIRHRCDWCNPRRPFRSPHHPTRTE
eukprot:ctg_191.g83